MSIIQKDFAHDWSYNAGGTGAGVYAALAPITLTAVCEGFNGLLIAARVNPVTPLSTSVHRAAITDNTQLNLLGGTPTIRIVYINGFNLIVPVSPDGIASFGMTCTSGIDVVFTALRGDLKFTIQTL